MRLFVRVLLALACGCVGGGGDPDRCGPTSEWPHRVACNDQGASGEDDDSDESSSNDESEGDGDATSGPSTPSGGGKTPPAGAGGAKKDAGGSAMRDAGGGNSASMDAGAAPSPGAGDGSEGGAADAGEPDGLVGPSQTCSVVAPSPDAGLCDGGACMSTGTSIAGACLSSEDLSLACDGEVGRAVAECAEDEILRLGMGRSVAMCARRAPAISAASTGCIDCYVEEILCAAENCFVPCVAGFSEQCRLCRLASCGEALQSCSGLYVPTELTRPRGVDAGL